MQIGPRFINYGKQIGNARWLFVLALWVPFLFTLNVAFLALQAHHSNDRDSYWVLHTAEVKDQLEHVNSLVKDAEISVRGYLLTGNAHFLPVFGDAQKEIPGQSQKIALLVADNPRQVTRAEHLRTMIANELLADAQLLALAQQEKKPDATHISETDLGQSEDEIQTQVKALATEEDRLFAMRENASLSQETIQNHLMIGLLSMESALIVGATLLIWRLETSRQKARARTVEATAQAEQARAHEEKVIRASELRYRRLFETARDGILILEADTGQVVDANPFIKQLLGYSQEEILGRKLWEIAPFNEVAAAKLTFDALQNAEFIRCPSLPLETKDGRRIEVEFVSSTYLVGQNRLIQSNIRDIMERKNTEQQLMLLETCVSTLSDIILLTEVEEMDEGGGKIVFANKAFERMTGYTFAETIGQTPRFLQGEKTDRRVMAEIHEAVAKRQPIRRQIINYRKDGSEFWLDIDIVPIFDAAGKCTNFAAVERDISEEKKREESLNLFRSLMEHSLDAIEVIDPDTGRFLDFNATACERLGYSREEMLSLCLPDLMVAGEGPFSLHSSMEEIRKNGSKSIESRRRRKDGSSFPVEINVQYIELNRGYLVAVVRNITDRKRNEARFRRLVDSNVQAVFFWNKKGEITGANDAFLSLLHYTREDLTAGRIGWMAMTPPEYADIDARALEDVVSTGACTPFEKEFIRKDGSQVSVLVGAATFEDNRDEGVAFALDLTERKRAAGQIAEQAVLLDEARDGILMRDIDGTIHSWNKGAERIYGWTRQEAIGGNVCDFYVSDQNEFVQNNKVLLGAGEWQGELRHLTKDGRTITVDGHWTLMRDEEGNPRSVLCINSDVTEKKNIEAQFMRAQRMESIGTLAGGVAHDLNNILAPIMMAIEILKSTSNDPQAKSILGTIEMSARRGADIVRQVLSFARGIEGARV